jgi:hypothetical protein
MADEDDLTVVTCPISEAIPFDPVEDPLRRQLAHLQRLVAVHRGEAEEREAELAGAPVRKPLDPDGRRYPREPTANLAAHMQLGLRRFRTSLYAAERALVARRATRAVFAELQREADRLAWIEDLDTPVRRDPLAVRLEDAAYRRATSLSLAGLGLASVPPAAWSIRTLRELDLSGNNLEAVPGDLARLTRLRRLNLAGNRLAGAALPPAAVPALSRLEHLDVSNNTITSLAPVLELPALKECHAAGNQIESIPGPALAAAAALELLDVSGNPLAQLPSADDIGECATLRRLVAAGTAITEVAEDLLHVETLQQLVVSNCDELAAPPRDVANDGRGAMLKWFKQKAQEALDAENESSGSDEGSEDESSS